MSQLYGTEFKEDQLESFGAEHCAQANYDTNSRPSEHDESEEAEIIYTENMHVRKPSMSNPVSVLPSMEQTFVGHGLLQ